MKSFQSFQEAAIPKSNGKRFQMDLAVRVAVVQLKGLSGYLLMDALKSLVQQTHRYTVKVATATQTDLYGKYLIKQMNYGKHTLVHSILQLTQNVLQKL